MGIVQAVDVFGLLPGGVSVTQFSSPVQICLRGTGSVYFISAVDNSVQLLPAVQNNGYLCVSLTTAGKLILLGSPNPGAQPPSFTEPSAPLVSTPLSQCQVTTTNAPLNLRAEPNTSAAILDQLPYDLTLTATERVPGWYRVIYLDMQGWVSAIYVSTLGDC